MAEGRNLRKTFAFSKRDEATNQWWEAQENPSISLQLLIREEIERNGFTDKLNAPVAQLPRRGRPPRNDGDPEQPFEYQIESAKAEPESAYEKAEQEAAERVPMRAPASAPEPARQPEPQPQPKRERVSVPSRPAADDEDSTAAADAILGQL